MHMPRLHVFVICLCQVAVASRMLLQATSLIGSAYCSVGIALSLSLSVRCRRLLTEDQLTMQDEVAQLDDVEAIKTDLISSRGIAYVKFRSATAALRAKDDLDKHSVVRRCHLLSCSGWSLGFAITAYVKSCETGFCSGQVPLCSERLRNEANCHFVYEECCMLHLN